MFTGIIQTVGEVEHVRPGGAGLRLTIRTPRALPGLAVGESIAVGGACLTVTSRGGRSFSVDVSPETLRRTTLGRARKGTRVNLERALRLGDRLGGHIVQGHVDGTGRLAAIKPDGEWVVYRFAGPAKLAPFLVEKGSIAVDGVSLTMLRCRDGGFSVALIPHTLSVTTLGALRPGDRVNLEADVMLKELAVMLRRRSGQRRSSRRR